MAAFPPLTPPRRAVAAALAFLAAAALAGITQTATGVEYRVFGITEGILGLLFIYILLSRGVWRRAPGIIGWLPVVYGLLATGQVLELLLPPPGIIEWFVVALLALLAWSALASGSRRRLAAALASLALLLALLKFSVIPVLLSQATPSGPDPLGLGNLTAGIRRFFVAEAPAAGGQLAGFTALCCWAIGTYLLWPPEDADAASLRDRIERVLDG